MNSGIHLIPSVEAPCEPASGPPVLESALLSGSTSRPRGRGRRPWKVLTLFGTRPEVIKLAPVIQQLEADGARFRAINVASGQHTTLLYPLVDYFGLRIDHDLQVMEPGQTLNGLCARVLARLDPVLTREEPDAILVQGDTTTAFAGALAGFHRQIPVGHVEAGLRTGNAHSPFPEEMNRRLISRMATFHLAATTHNRANLLAEGVAAEQIAVTGNPVVDSLQAILRRPTASPAVETLLEATRGLKRLVLTAHRRENFGDIMAGNFQVLRDFVERHADVALLFPVHPNPAVRGPALRAFGACPRVHLLEPLGYLEFVRLLSEAWLIVSDSGGVQEEVPTLGKPLLVLRENTERPEAVEAGVARLTGGCPERLRVLLEEVYRGSGWSREVAGVQNPFGNGESGPLIVSFLARQLEARAARLSA